MNLYYKEGLLQTAATRGDGKIGENVISNIINVKNIPSFLKGTSIPKEIKIRGEIYLNKNDFLELNSKLSKKEKFSILEKYF